MRGVPRWVSVLAVVATGAVVCAFTVHAHDDARNLRSTFRTPQFPPTGSLPRN